tara:strand:- start:2109 stop:3233 length:1125 start_codon:yes stop_codon:yes gene_type:complete
MQNINKLEFLFVLLVIILFCFYLIFKNSFWEFFIIPIGSYNLDFTDLRCIKSWERLYNDYSDLNEIYNDNLGCKLNYPRIWIFFSKFFLNDNFFYPYLIINFVIYSTIFFYLIRTYKTKFLVYFYISGSSMLLLERGNVEILIFILIFLFLISKKFLKILFLSLSIILKIFPFFSLISQLNKKNIKVFITCLILSILYFVYSFTELNFIFENTPSTGDISYGTKAITSNLEKHYSFFLNNYILSGIILVSTFIFYKVFFYSYVNKIRYKNDEMFLAGGGIYAATFLLNSNHDYRMIFLIFLIPLIVNLEDKIIRYIFFISIFLSLELNRLIYFLGFYGGIINTFFKIILFFLVSLILLDILIKKFINNELIIKK